MSDILLDEGTKQIYFNPPQLKSYLVDANEEMHVWGRGTGKSSGPLAYKSRRNLLNMPRACGVVIGETYQQLLTRTLPSLINGWEKLGFIKDLHYVVGKRPPAAWSWPEPYEPPLDYKHFIATFNGAGIHLVSQDRKGSSNGLNTDWHMGDEAKYLDYDQYLDETLPTMRANRQLFGHLYYHHSIVFTTSMPTAADAKWILKKEGDMDRDQVQLIMRLALEVIKLEQELLTRPASYSKQIKAKINAYNKELNTLRKDCLYYSEADSFENAAVLGEEYFRKMRRIMPDFVWDTEIKNIKPDQIQGGFYPMFDVKHHTYANAYNNTFLEKFEYDFARIENEMDCRQDADLVRDLPLWIAVDWGAAINCLTALQDLPMERRILNSMHVKHPEYLDHLAKKFCDYYKPHKTKVVYFAYDHTGNTRVANSHLTYAQQFKQILEKEGWIVHDRGKLMAPTHQEKYLLNCRVLGEEIPGMKVLRMNKSNCQYLIISMMQAPAKQGRNGIEKDKSSERDKKKPQEEATHYSDTFDILIDALYDDILNQAPDYLDTVYSNR